MAGPTARNFENCQAPPQRATATVGAPPCHFINAKDLRVIKATIISLLPCQALDERYRVEWNSSLTAMASVMKPTMALRLFWAASVVLWHCSASSHNVTYMRIPTANATHFKSSSFHELRLDHLPLERQSSSRTDGEVTENRFLDNDLYPQCRNRFVCDLDSILSSDQIDAMERELQQFSKRFFPKNGILASGFPATEMVSIHLHVVLLRMVRSVDSCTARKRTSDRTHRS